MSRFRDGTPRKDNSQLGPLSQSPEDEIINSILRERQERLHTISPSKASAAHVPILQTPTAQRTHARQESVSAPVTPQQPNFGQDDKTLNVDTPLHLFSSSYDGDKTPNRPTALTATVREEYAESYISHTKESVEEASAILSNSSPSKRLSTSPTSFRAISQMMARVKSNTSDTSQLFLAHEQESSKNQRSPVVQSNSRDNSVDHDRANKSFEHAQSAALNSREVADGYISPPQSRHTSPKSPRKALTKITFNSPTPVVYNNSIRGSPSPSLPRRFVQEPVPRRVEQFNHGNIPSSPRSRLTRTLIEIQQDLANSREGIESIESRLGVLEQHRSLDADQMKKHVEDCIRNMVEEADDTLLSSGESLQFEKDNELSSTDTVLNSAGELGPTLDQGQILMRGQKGTITSTVKALALVGLGLLAAEYLLMRTINELGRRHILFMN